MGGLRHPTVDARAHHVRAGLAEGRSRSGGGHGVMVAAAGGRGGPGGATVGYGCTRAGCAEQEEREGQKQGPPDGEGGGQRTVATPQRAGRGEQSPTMGGGQGGGGGGGTGQEQG